MTFSERLKKLRQEKEVTQSEVGKLLAVSRRMISFYETGKSFPSDAESLVKLAKYFDVSVDYLLCTSEIENYDNMVKTFKIYTDLPEIGKEDADEYMRFLMQKYKVKQPK